MSWFQSLRDDFTLRPFESPQTPSDGAAMASGPADSINQEPADVQEDCSGKKKSKFQTFKKFFTRKKRKEPSTAGADAGLKASQSSDNVSKTSDNNALTRSEREKGSGSKVSLGGKALSHDSVFVSDSSEANEALGASQDSISGKVKSLQLQLKQAMKLSSLKRTDDAGAMSEDDGLPCSPPECSTPHSLTKRSQMKSNNSLLDSDDDQLSCSASSRAVSPLVVPGDFSQPASPFGCLDSSGAKHKLGLRQKARNKRKPATRLEWKTEGDSAVEETLTDSVPGETASLEEQKQQTEDPSGDQAKPKLDREEDEEEEYEERGHPPDPTVSLLRDKEKGEEGEDEPEAEQDVSHGPDTSCPAEPSLSEDEGSDDQAPPSSTPGSRAESLDTSRATPEPPAGPGEYLSGPAGDHRAERDSASAEEDEVQESWEEESSFLQEVLSSLKTPLESRSLDVEAKDVVLERKEDKRKKEEVEKEESVEIKEEPGVDGSVGYRASSYSVQSGQTSDGEEEAAAPSLQEEVDTLGEEENSRGEEAEEEEEDLVLEQVTQDAPRFLQLEEEGQDDEPEEDNLFTGQALRQEREDRAEEEEEEATKLGEEGSGKPEEDDDDGEVEEQVNDLVEVEEPEQVMEIIPDSQNEEIQSTSAFQEAGAAAVLGEDDVYNTEDTSDEVHDPGFTTVQEGQGNLYQREDEREDGEQEAGEEEAGEDELTGDVSEDEDKQEDVAVENRTALHLEEEGAEMLPQIQKEQLTVSPKPPLLRLSDPPSIHSQEGASLPSSKTPIMHVNLASPPSEGDAASFQLSSTSAKDVMESLVPTDQGEAPVDEEQTDAVEDVEEKQPTQGRFTIASAWQRSQDHTSPPSSPACTSSPREEEDEATRDQAVKDEPASSAPAEVESSPGRAIDAESTAGTPPSSSVPAPDKPPSSAYVLDKPLSSTPTPDKPSSSVLTLDKPPSSAYVPDKPPSSTPTPDKLPSSVPTPDKPPSSPPTPDKPPSSTPTPDKLPSSVPTPDKPPSSTPVLDKPPSSVPTPDKPPSSVPTPDKPPSSVPTPDKPPSSTPVPDKLPSSPPTPDKLPSSPPTPDKLPSSPPTPDKLPSSPPTPYKPPSSAPVPYKPPSSAPVPYKPPSSVPAQDKPPNSPPTPYKPPSSAPVPYKPPNSVPTLDKPPSSTPVSDKPPGLAAASTAESAVVVEGNPDNPFGIRLRKTSTLLHLSSEEETHEPSVESLTPPSGSKVDTPPPPPPVSSKPPVGQSGGSKPALPKKPEVQGDAGGQTKRVSDAAGGRGASGALHRPSWVSVAKQKQKIYKENSLEEISVKKEEPDRKSSLPSYVSSAASREQSNKTVESSSNVVQVEISKPPVSVEKEPRRTLPSPSPVPPQPSKSQPPPCPITPKPQLPSPTSRPSPQPTPPQRSLSPPTPVPVASKPLNYSPPSHLSKPAAPPKTPPVTSPPFSPKTPVDKAGSRAPALPGQVSPQRALSPPVLPQDEPPWMALAKKKAKAWSEMPQIVQ
ncbi:capping protein-inhibiting regulator of actin dynamics isoform X3 [Cololabis saira]|uniref:capping protein-inhibiting regulator of actin dynamics isoform X3 n=1 Tax=Cololabis saira TaxID=129043 RepID=UPI002AD1E047|nr:capping protein-inhibiting regulator of actin dynamics isoform X3 [Cololabis saira]